MNRPNKEQLTTFGTALLIAIIGFWVAYQFVQPAPPARIVISAGREDGAYYLFAKQYQEILARDNVTLEVLRSAGSVENIERLQAKTGGADVAFVQGATNKPIGSRQLLSLGSLYYEPLWVFYSSRSQLKHLTDLRGKRLAVGEKGSGTRSVTLQLLEDNTVTAPPAALFPLAGQDAADALLQGDVDAAFFIVSPRSATVRKLLVASGIKLMSFERAEAYTRIHRDLSTVTLPQGAIDLGENIPASDTVLLAPTANLVVRSDFHPALIDLLLQAATEVHGAGDVFERPGEFPSPIYLEYPLSQEARRYYERGRSFLQRYLPFWAATFFDRMMVMLVPLIVVLLPLVRVVPPAYKWRIRRKIYRWYKDVKAVDVSLREEQSPERLTEYMTELDRIEDGVNEISTPLTYADQVYNLRMHIHLVRTKLINTKKDVLEPVETASGEP
ncbi:MAG: TAXI family TRAP transporter solute-binding subunit [Gammaproteobacteria bacterium]